MASAEVLGAPGLPQTVFSDHNVYNSIHTDQLKRSYAMFAAMDDTGASDAMQASHFDPEKHLNFVPPSKIYSMVDLGLPATNGISPVAVSEPFSLFNEQAIMEMRKEILSEKVLKKYSFTSDIAPLQLRGSAPKDAKFMYDAWKHPKTLAIVSQIAGVELVPVVDYEIGHINISKPGAKKEHDSSQMISEDDNKSVVDWHRDSYPFVCVVMMSDTIGMEGGETALRTGSGEIRKVRGPSMGSAVILQGRYIEHQALRAFGGKERITMVTSFRAKSPFIRDDTVLNTVRPVSSLPDLYGQVIEYQLENMEARLRRMLKKVRSDLKAGVTDVRAYKDHFDFEIAALQHLNHEIIEESKIEKGKLAATIEEERQLIASRTT